MKKWDEKERGDKKGMAKIENRRIASLEENASKNNRSSATSVYWRIEKLESRIRRIFSFFSSSSIHECGHSIIDFSFISANSESTKLKEDRKIERKKIHLPMQRETQKVEFIFELRENSAISRVFALSPGPNAELFYIQTKER